MSDTENNKHSRWKKWKENFRVTVINPETLQEVSSFQMNRLLIAGIVAIGAFFAILLFSLLVVLTPLRKYIPGYGDIREHPELLRLNEDMKKMEEELEAHKAYSESFRRMLVGEPTETADAEAQIQEEFPDSLLNVERIKEDELLRKEIEFDQQKKQQAVLTANGNVNPGLSPEQMFLVPPLSGVLSAVYDPMKKHYGTDITAPKNTPVQTIQDGYVFMADWTLETGFTLGIQHGNELISFYKHNSALLKKAGDRVKAGEAVAIIGNTGTLSTGPHLHFELWYRGAPVNPEDYVVFQ